MSISDANANEDKLVSMIALVQAGKVNPALHAACVLGETDLARRLVTDAGADPNTLDMGEGEPNNIARRPIHSAIFNFHGDTARSMIALGADPDARTKGDFHISVYASADTKRDLPRTPKFEAIRAEIIAAIAVHAAKAASAPAYTPEFSAATAAAPLTAEVKPNVLEVLVIAADDRAADPDELRL